MENLLNPSAQYFYRNRGEWNWTSHLVISSWLKLWKSDYNFLSKLKLSLFVLSQKIVGPYAMRTYVHFEKGSSEVRHTTRILKFGISVVRSEKVFRLGKDGVSLTLEGKEYYWPFTWIAVPFSPTHGSVASSTTRAQYLMPVAGIPCHCNAILEATKGEIEIAMPWLSGRFVLTSPSMKELAARFSIDESGARQN